MAYTRWSDGDLYVWMGLLDRQNAANSQSAIYCHHCPFMGYERGDGEEKHNVVLTNWRAAHRHVRKHERAGHSMHPETRNRMRRDSREYGPLDNNRRKGWKRNK